MNNTYLENRQKKNYVVSLFKPSGEYQGKLLVDNVQVKLDLQGLSTMSFSIPEYVAGILNPRLNEVLDNFEIELEYGNIETYKTKKERFIIRKQPLGFSNDITTFNFDAVSKQVMLEDKKIVSWGGIKKLRYYETTTANFTSTLLVNLSPRIENFTINGIINDLITVQVFRIDTKTSTEILLLKADILLDVNETNYYYDGADFHVGIPSQISIDETVLSDTYNYRVYYEADAKASGAEEQEYYTKDGLSITEVMEDILVDTPYSLGTISSSFDDTYRSNFKFNNKSKHKAIGDVEQSFDAVAIYDNINLTISFYKIEEYGEDKGLTLRYGKYLTDITKEIDGSKVATIVKALGKNNLTLSGATATGLNSYEDYSYYLDDAAIDGGNNLISSSRWMSDGLARALLIWLEARDAYDDELYVLDGGGLFKNLYSEVAELISSNDELIRYNAKIFNATSVKDTYIESGQSNTFERNFNEVNYTDPVTYYQAQIDYYEAEKVSIQAAYDILDSSIQARQSRLVDIAATLDRDLYYTSNQLDELALFTKEVVFKENTITEYLTLLDEAKTYFSDYSQPQVTIAVQIIDIMQAGEAAVDWDKVLLGDKINIYFPRFNIDLEAQIKEISMNLDSYSMSIKISTIKRYNEGFGKFLGKTIRRLTESERNETDYHSDQSQDDRSQIDIFRQQQASGYNTNEGITINAGRQDINKNSSLIIDENGLVLTELEVDLETDQIKPKAGGSKIRMINGGIYIVDENDNVKTAITTEGVSAAQLVGEVLLGEKLIIKSGDNDFYVGPGGVGTIMPTNDFGITLEGIIGTSTVTNRIIISKNQGLQILQSASGLFDDTVVVFEADAATGNVSFAGQLKASSGQVYSIDELVDVRFEYIGATRFTSYTDTNALLYTDLGQWQLKIYVDGIEVSSYANIGTGNPDIESIEWSTSGNVSGVASDTNLFTPQVEAYNSAGGTVSVDVKLVGIEKRFIEVNTIIANKQAASAGAKYTWVKYSSRQFDHVDLDGTDVIIQPSDILYDDAVAGTRSIGMSFNNDSNVESEIPNDYEWSAYKGLDGDPGVDGYAILCSNEAMVIAADRIGNIIAGQDTSALFNVLIGPTARNVIVDLNGVASGCSVVITNNNTQSVTITLSNFTADNGYAKFNIYDDDHASNIKIGEKIVTYSKSKQGEIGYNIVLDSEIGTVLTDQDGDVITAYDFTVIPRAYTGVVEVPIDSVVVANQTNCTASVLNTVITITPLKVGDIGYSKYLFGSVDINMTINNELINRIFNITTLKVGEDTYSILLSNESSSIPADKDGNVDNAYEEVTTVSVYRGSVKLTSGYTITTSSSVNCLEKSIIGDIVTINSFTDGQNNGSIDIDVNITAPNIDITRTFVFSVSKTGLTGDKGEDSSEVYLNTETDTFYKDKGVVISVGEPYDIINKLIQISIGNVSGSAEIVSVTATPTNCTLVTAGDVPITNPIAVSGLIANVYIDTLTADTGTIVFNMTTDIGNSYTKTYSFIVVEQGDAAKLVKINATDYAIELKSDGKVNGLQTIDITAEIQGSLGTLSWVIPAGPTVSNITGGKRLSFADDASISFPLTVSYGDGTVVDTLTIIGIKPGTDAGDPTNVYIAYSENSDGTDYETTPSILRIYIGTATGTTAPSDKFGYIWVKYLGTNADDPLNVYIRYSKDGTTEILTAPDSNTKYIGVYVGTSASSTIGEYAWSEYIGTDGDDALSGLLTNEAALVAAENDGTGYGSGSIATGDFLIFEGIIEVVGTFSILGGVDETTVFTKIQNGLKLTLNVSTGDYSVTEVSTDSWVSDTESFTLEATYSETTITKIFTISKSKKGYTPVLDTDYYEYHTHIRYSDDGGTTFTGNNGQDVGLYMGTLVTTSPTASLTPGDYIPWARLVGAGIVFRGTYSASETYYCTDTRKDIVKYLSVYYIANNTAKNDTSTWGIPPIDWEPFGAQFDSVATGLLLTQDAVITQTLVIGSSTTTGVIRSDGMTTLLAGTGFYFDGLSGDFTVGEAGGNSLSWSNGTLSIVGDLGGEIGTITIAGTNPITIDSLGIHAVGFEILATGSATFSGTLKIGAEVLDATNTLNENTTAGDVDLGNVDNTTDASVLASAATAANSAAKNGGSISGWSIDGTYIWSGTKKTSDGYSSSGLTLASDGSLRSPNFYIDGGTGSAFFKGDFSAATATIGEIKINTNGIYAQPTSFDTGFEDGYNNLGGWILTGESMTIGASTPSNGTGPSAAYSGTKFLFIEASGTFYKKGEISFNFSEPTTSQEVLTFRYHAEGNDCESLKIYLNGSVVATRTLSVGSITVWTYISETIPIGTTRITIAMKTGSSFVGDISIDSLTLTNNSNSKLFELNSNGKINLSGSIGGWQVGHAGMFSENSKFTSKEIWFGLQNGSSPGELRSNEYLGGMSSSALGIYQMLPSGFIKRTEILPALVIGSGGADQSDFVVASYENLLLVGDYQLDSNRNSVYAYIGVASISYGGLVQTNDENISSAAIKTNIIDIMDDELFSMLDNLNVVRYDNLLTDESEISIIIEDSANQPLSPELIKEAKTTILFNEKPEHLNETSMSTIEKVGDSYKLTVPELNMKSYVSLAFASAQLNHRRIKQLEEENKQLKSDLQLIKDHLSLN